ncbi:MAG: DNA polymerase III subunit alpha [Gammaproteobacteria bacterium]|nr:DNA polymerase III subunit alpha [Gammaproteobacteria bacterium]
MQTPFVHLRNHSEYSLSDGLLRVPDLVRQAAQSGVPAVALTDRCNFYALVKFQKAAFAAGVKPIFGAEITWSDEPDELPFLLTLLVQNAEGYKNLVELISLAYTQGQDLRGAVVQRDWIEKHAAGLIALSGASEGDVGRALLGSSPELAEQHAAHWHKIFGDRYYLDLQRLGRENDERYVAGAVALAEKMQLPVVATNACCFMQREDFEAHEVRVCINDSRTLDDPRRPRNYSEEQYVKSPEEMGELFNDIPEALQNSVVIAQRCSMQVQLGTHYLPEYPIPKGKTQEQFFSEVSHQGLEQRLVELFDPQAGDFEATRERYRARLDFEVETILQMGFPGYFLIVMDFIRWAKQNDIPVGPGRGSGAGSLVAYSLGITDLDPLAYDLLFERFLNPERVSMPDFDVDFCMEKRDRVIQYVAETYGREAVGQIITFGTMAAKAVVRDVARAQGKSYGLADKLSKMIPFEVGMTLKKALEQEEPLRKMLEEDGDAQEIWDMAVQLEGTTRNVGKHAGGVVIAPSKLTDFAPLYCDEQGQGLVTQYDKNDVEDAGLVKFDFLGLRTLTIIDWALAMVNRRRASDGDAPIAIEKLALDDADTYRMLQEANTTAVFQLESRGMKDLIKRLKPDRFEDIVALVALFRPGPLQSGMVDDFINRKLGRAELAFPHPRYQHESLQPILQPTYGIILYQEQVMQIAQTMAGYSLGEADLLRRAMGKKKPEEMARQGERFIKGALELGHGEELAQNIFELMEKFAGYGFNKSHSAAYALVSYHTAWLKRHYPAEFMAAVLSSEMQNTDKIVTLIDECRNIGLVYTPPDVNIGEYLFSVDGDARVVYGLGAIKGLGEGPVEAILEARRERPFTDLFDFCRRTDARKLNKRALEALVRSGAFDSLGEPRWLLMAALPEAIKAAEQQTANKNAGIDDLFGEYEAQGDEDVYAKVRQTRPWLLQKILLGEKETLGLFLSGHPIDSYEEELASLVKRRLREVQPGRGKQRVAGMIVAMRTMKTKKGDSMAFLTLDDRTSRIEVSVYARVFEELRELLVKDAIVLVDGTVAQDDYTGGLSIRADTVQSLAQARKQRAAAIELALTAADLGGPFIADLKQLLHAQIEQFGMGDCGISVRYRGQKASTMLSLGKSWRVHASDELIDRLREMCGEQAVRVRYRRSPSESHGAGFAHSSSNRAQAH